MPQHRNIINRASTKWCRLSIPCNVKNDTLFDVSAKEAVVTILHRFHRQSHIKANNGSTRRTMRPSTIPTQSRQKGKILAISKNNDGTFTAVTFTQSRTFKTYSGAVRWLAARA